MTLLFVLNWFKCYNEENMEIEKIIGDYNEFLDRALEKMRDAGFDLEEFEELDHIAYRTETDDRYEDLKNELIEFSEAYNEEFFGGRNILVCRLREPLRYNGFEVPGFELLAPKEDNEFVEGLEHAEFVIRGTLKEFKERHNDIDFNLDAYDRDVNPELIVEFDDCAVKFHEKSLLDVRGI